jgi:hypothetical protein
VPPQPASGRRAPRGGIRMAIATLIVVTLLFAAEVAWIAAA